MPTKSPDQSSAHVTLVASHLEEVFGGAGLGPFPGAEVGTAAGMGITETWKQRGNIANAFNSAHRWGHENGWAAINGARNAVGNFFNPPTPGPSTYHPATANPDGSINPGRSVPR